MTSDETPADTRDDDLWWAIFGVAQQAAWLSPPVSAETHADFDDFPCCNPVQNAHRPNGAPHMATEAFTEYRPAREGSNLQHHALPGRGHITGPDCPCKPTVVPHYSEDRR